MDSWGWIAEGKPCFARETNKAEIGFDDRRTKFTQQTNVPVSAADARDVLRKMKGPKGSYSGTYTFVGTGGCGKCTKKQEELQKNSKAPVGEALSISGVGDFTSENDRARHLTDTGSDPARAS